MAVKALPKNFGFWPTLLLFHPSTQGDAHGQEDLQETWDAMEGAMNLFNPLPEPDDELPLEHAMTQLADQFTDYHCINAFLCESYTSIMSSHEPMKQEVIQLEKGN